MLLKIKIMEKKKNLRKEENKNDEKKKLNMKSLRDLEI